MDFNIIEQIKALDPVFVTFCCFVLALLILFILRESWAIRGSKEYPAVKLFISKNGLLSPELWKEKGGIAIPHIHKVIYVDLSPFQMEILRSKENALATKDSLRMDVETTISLKVSDDERSILLAAQRLGSDVYWPDKFQYLFRDQLISVIRQAFMQRGYPEVVQDEELLVIQIMEKSRHFLSDYGLVVSEVSFTRLELSPREYYQKNSPRDVIGLKNLDKVRARGITHHLGVF